MNISAITPFEENFYPFIINNSFEVATFESEPTFEKIINEIKGIHLKNITSTDMNVSDITLNEPSPSSEHLKYNLMQWIPLLSPVKSPQFTNNLSSMRPKGYTQLQILKW